MRRAVRSYGPVAVLVLVLTSALVAGLAVFVLPSAANAQPPTVAPVVNAAPMTTAEKSVLLVTATKNAARSRFVAAQQRAAAARQAKAAEVAQVRTRIVQVARKQLGDRYSAGSSGPHAFDCSGFTMYVYRQVGVFLPRTSRSQFGAGSRIAPDRLDLLEPGDLVFFGYNADPGQIHHVGIYSGNGLYIHAPQTGEMISESSLVGRIATRGDYVGAVRP